MSGKIVLLLGPMCAGKSTELKRLLRKHQHAKKRIIALKNAIDVRNEDDRKGLLSSRDNSTPIVATVVEKLSEFSLEGVEKAVIGIDEGQFFSPGDLTTFCLQAAQQNNLVIVAALSSDVNGDPWPSIAPMTALVDDIQFFAAVCDFCGEDAAFTVKLGGGSALIDVAAKYAPACRKCFYQYHNKESGV